MLTVVTDNEPTPAGTTDTPGRPATIGGSLIDEIVPDGARRMLAAALEAEVAAYIAAYADQFDERGRRLVVRNCRAEARRVVTSAGAVEVVAPRVNDKRTEEATGERRRFASAILPPWCHKSLAPRPPASRWRSSSSKRRRPAGGWSTRHTSSPSSAPAPISTEANSSNGPPNRWRHSNHPARRNGRLLGKVRRHGCAIRGGITHRRRIW